MTSRKQLAINQRALYDDAVKNKMFWNATPSFQEFQRRLQNPKYVQTVQANYRAHGRSGDAFDTLSGFRDYFCVSDEDKQDMTQGVGNMIADTKARLAGQQRYNKLKQHQDKQRGRYGRLDLGVKNPLTNDNVVRDDATDTYLTSQGAEYAQEYEAARAQNHIDETGKRYTEAVERGDLPSAFEVQDEDGNYALMEDLGVKPGVHVTEKGKQQQLAGLVNTRKSVEEQYNALYRKLEEDFKRSAPFSLNTHSQYGIDDNDMRLQAYLNSNAQYRRLKAQLHQLDNAIGVGEEAVKGRAEERYVKNAKGMLGYAYRDLKSFGASALRGLWNAVSDVSTWDLGLQDLQDNMTLYTTVKKARQKGYKNLNDEERQMLDVAAKTGAYTAENQQYLGRGYKAGNVTGESLPFMVEMALNPASGLGEAVMSKYMRNAIAKYGKEAVRKEAWKYVTKKCGYRVAGDVLGAALMTGTTGSARTLADTYDRLTGDIKSTYDSDGKIVYDGTENEEKGILKAYLKAFGATAIENHSEFVGEYFNPLLKGVGTLTMKGWKKVNAKSANAFLDNLKDMGSTSTAKWLGNLFDKTQWHGTIGEYAEEVVGNIENALLVGDSTLDTKEGTGVFNLDQNIDTFLGVSLMGGFFSTLKTGAYVRDKVKGERKILMQQSLDLDNSIRYALGADPRLADKWKEWRVALAQGTDEEKKQALKEISENTNGNIKKAMYDYSANAQKLAGMDKATQGAIEDGTITPEQAQRDADIEQAHEEGLAAEGTARHDIQQEHQLRENSLARMLGISAEQLDRMEDEDIESMTGQNDALDTAIYDYQTSRERYQGVIDRATDEVEQAGIDAAHQIDLYTDHSTGQIRPCVIKGNNGKEDYQGYIVNGNIATHPDGAIDVSGSDKMILYFDPETGKIEHGDASTFASLGESADATVARQQAIDEAKQQAAQAQSRDIDGGVGEDGNVSEAMPTFPQSSDQEERNAADFDIGQVVNAETGEVIPVSFEGLAEGENAYLTGGRPDGKTKDRLKVTIVDAEGNVTNRVMKRGNVQVDGRMSAEDFRNAYEEAVSSRMAPEADINEQENNVDEEGVVAGDAAPSADKAATSEEEGAASEPAVRDKNGNPIYDKMPISATIADLYDGALDDAEIDGFVSAQIAEAEKAVEKMEKKKPKVGTDKAKYLADKKAWEEGLQEAQRKVQYWQDVKSEVEKITTPEDARGWEEELSGKAAKDSYHEHGRSKDDVQNEKEVTAEFMQSSDTKITPESYRKETGFGITEQRAMVGRISNKGKSIDRLAEELETYDREYYNGRFFGGDSTLAKDAIIGYLSSADSRKGVGRMQSESEAEYVEAYEEERDRFYQEKYHLSYEEYLAYSAAELPELLRKYSNFDEQQFYNLYAEEIEADLERREKQLKHINNGKEGNVSAGEEPRHGRGNQVQSGQRVDDIGRGEVGKDSAGEVGPRHEGVVESEAASEEPGNGALGNVRKPKFSRRGRVEGSSDERQGDLAETGDVTDKSGQAKMSHKEKTGEKEPMSPTPAMIDRMIEEQRVDDVSELLISSELKKAAEDIAEAFGMKVVYLKKVFIKSDDPAVEDFEGNGFVRNGVIYLSLKEANIAQFTFGHELLHQLKQIDADSYMRIRQKVIAVMGRKAFEMEVKARQMTYANVPGYTLFEDYAEEVIADTLGDIITHTDMLPNIARSLKENPSLLDRFLKVVDNVRQYFRGKTGGALGDLVNDIRDTYEMTARQGAELGLSTPLKITEHTRFSLKSKPVRFEAGKKLSDEEKKEVLSTLKDAYKVNGVPYHIEETAGGKEKRVYEPTADSYVVSDITNRPLRYYITLPDGRVAHPTEVYPNISDNEVKSSATKQGLLDDEAYQIVSAAIGNMKDIADNAKAVEVLTELQNLPHETHDVGYGLNNAQSYNYKTGIFTSDAAQAIDYVVRRMRRKENIPAEIPAALKKAVADSYGMVDNLIDGMSSTKFSLKDNQGNPLNQDGTLKLDKIKSVDELTDEDFLHPTRNVELPSLPKKIADAIGTEGKPVVIKKNIFERNYMRHKDVTPDLSKIIFKSALYNPDLYGQNQKKTRPYNWVLINTKDEKGNNRTVLLEVNPNKDNVEIVHWHFVNDKNLGLIKKQAIREGDQVLILPSEQSEEVGGLSNLTDDLSAANIDNSSETAKESEGKDRQRYASLGVSRQFGDGERDGEREQQTANERLKGEGYQYMARDKFSLRLAEAKNNTDKNPSQAQKESGNYRKGHIRFGGYNYTIENPQGSYRSGVDENGKKWKQKMNNTYGYILGTKGKDGDHLDMFINDKADLDSWNGNVYVVDQVLPDGSFDEHKVMYGFDSEEEARKAYLSNYEQGWQGLGNITGVSKEDFDRWLEKSGRKTKAFGEYKNVKLESAESPKTGAFGTVYTQFRGKAQEAFDFLASHGSGDLLGVFHREGVGDIDAVWGDKGGGLDHIIRKHIGDGKSFHNIVEAANVIDDIIKTGSKAFENGDKIVFKKGSKLVTIRKNVRENGKKIADKNWVLTAYDELSADGDVSAIAPVNQGQAARTTGKSQRKDTTKPSYSQKKNVKSNKKTPFSLKNDRTLAGVHNITEEKLRKAIKQGGLANPSVAVIDSSKQNHDAYGDISLILPSYKVAKRTGKNAGTWQGDAWTPTYPQVERQMSNKGAEKASNDVSSVPSDMYSEVRRGLDRWLDGGEENSAMAYMFLHEKGVAPEPKKIQPKFSDEAYNELKSITAGNFNIYGIGKADARKVLDMYIDAKFDGDKDLYEEKTKAWLERNKSIVDAGANGGMRYAIAKENVELYDEYGFNYKGVQTFVRDVEYDHRKTGVDMNATLNEVEDYIKTNNLTDEFNTWMEGKEKEYGIKEVIFDGFTPSGNRRYVPNTLENVSKIMKKQGRNGSTGTSVSFQNFAARLMPSYGTLKDIRSKKGLLTSDREKFDNFREKWSNVFFELGMKCQPDATGTFDDYGLARLSEAAMTSDPQAYLKKEYNVDFSDEDTKRLKEMVKAIKEESPAMYFETKFERPVHLDEFAAAVVPNDLGADVRKMLDESGIALYEYDPAKEGDRSRAFNEAINSSDNIRFSLDKDKGTVVSPSKPSKAEAVLRDAVIDRLRENGMEVITDVAEGQKVLDEANGRVRLMGSRTNKKMKEIADVLSEHELSEQQRTVVDVYSGKTDNLQLEVSRNDGNRRIVIRQGNDNKAGTKHSVYRHYGTTEGVITAEDILLIPEVLNRGERKSIKRGNTQLYEYVLRNVDGAEYTVLTEINNRGKETFADFYSNKKVSSTARKTRSSEAQARLDETLSAAKVEEKSKTANKSGEKLREQRVYHGSGAAGMHFFRTANGEAYGFTVGGKIYVDPRIATSETPVHEYAHLWASALRSGNAEEWQNVVSLMKDSKVWDEVKERYPELKSDDEIADEVIATYSGRHGAERLREEQRKIAEGDGGVFEKAEAISALESVKRALKMFWKGVADFLHIHYKNAEEVADRVMKDLLEGVDPRMMEDGVDRQRYASLGVSRSLGEEAAEGEPRWASLGLSEPRGEEAAEGDDTIRFSLNYDKWNSEMASWLKRNRLPKNAQRPVVPQREIGESDLHFAGRLAKYNQDKALWNTAPKYEGHLSSGMTARGVFNYELQRGSVLMRIAVQDSMLAIRKAQEAIARHSGLLKVGTFEDAYMAENNSHGKAKNEFEQYDQEYLAPLRKWFNVMMKRLDGSYNNVTNYMIAKHGLERNAHMAFMAALEAEAKKAIDNTQPDAKRLRAQMVHDAYKQYKADSRRLINDADYQSGKYDYAQWRRTDDAIRKSYCSNYESFRYNKGGVVRDYAGLSSLFQNETDFEEKAAEMCADIESKNGQETSELWDAVRQATRQILKNSHDAGMMSDETYDYVRGMYEHYVPLRGWNDSAADEVWDYAGCGRGVFNAALKEAHGRQFLADDPVAYIMNMAESGFLVNNRNWVKQHFLMMAMNHPSDLLTVSKAWYVKSKDQFGNEVWIPASPNIPVEETDPSVIQAALDAFQTKMEQMEQSGDATQQRGSLNIEYPQTKSEEREHEVRVMKDGEEYVIYVNGDPQLAQALNNTRAMRVREHEGNFEKACAWLGRKMAAVYTSLSPLFVPSNWARDTTMTLASTAIREDARYNWLLRTKFMRPDVQMRMFGLVKEYQNGKLREKVKSRTATKIEENFWNFMINGGETGFVSTMDVDAFREKIQRDLKDMGRTRLNPVKIGHVIADSVEYINRVIEDSNRFAIYQTSIEYGRGIEEAVQDAKNVTLNFNRKGTGEMGMSAIRQLYLFINPAIQSLQTLGALAKEHKAKFTAVTSAWMASGMLVPLFNELMFNLASAAAGGGGDDDDEYSPKDEYWKFSSFDRRNNCILWIPFTHNFIKIPLAQEFRGFYGIGDMVASAMWGGENAKESWSNYAADLMGQIIDLSPLDPVSYDGNVLVSLMPNAIRPLVEIAQNVTFTGKPIYRESDFNKYDPSFKKAYAGTPDFLLRYSKWMNSIGNKYPEAQQGPVEQTAVGRYANNPAVIDHLLKSYLGGMYTLGSQIAGAITKASDEETRKDFKTADIPFFSKFVANPNDRPQSKNKGDAYWQDFEKYQRSSHTLGVIRQDARKTGNFSVLEDFYKSEEYKEMKEYEPKAKQRKEEQKYERLKEEGNADLYQPHQQTGEDVYKRHSTPADDFEDTKASILYQKIRPAKDIFDLADINTPSGMDTFNKYYDLAGKVEEAQSVKKEMNAIVKSFVNDEHKATFDPDKMKEYRALRKQYLQLVEDGNRMFEKIKAQRN